MDKKYKKCILFIVFTALMIIPASTVLNASVAVENAKTASVAPEVPVEPKEQPKVSGVPGGLKPGDIILLDSGGWLGWIIPGGFTHAQLVIHHDPNKIVHSDKHGVKKEGLTSNGKVMRVHCKDSTKIKAVNFGRAQEGKKYDYTWWTKAVHGSKYYCSELVWACYKANGVELDNHPGFHIKYLNGVAPQEINDDGSTYHVGDVTWK